MFDDHRAIVAASHPGRGIVGRWPTVVLVSGDDELNPTLDAATAPTIDQLATADGPLAAVVEQDGAVLALVRGGASAIVDGTPIAATEPRPIVGAETFTLAVDTASPAPDTAGLDLRAGTVPGVAITVTRDLPSPTPSFEVVDLRAGDAEARTPLPQRAPAVASPRPPQRPGDPIPSPGDPAPVAEASEPGSGDRAEPDVDSVLGIRCSRGHFNNPLTSYCQACGISMVHLTHQLVPGPRPTLGFVVFNDGATYALDRSYLLGRSPSVTPDDGAVAPLVVADADGSVSGRHARIDLVDWDVSISDLGSTNGTYVWNVSGHRWDRVGGQPIALSPGSIVAVGRTTFVFESAVRRR